jgi:hypothetical protein
MLHLAESGRLWAGDFASQIATEVDTADAAENPVDQTDAPKPVRRYSEGSVDVKALSWQLDEPPSGGTCRFQGGRCRPGV